MNRYYLYIFFTLFTFGCGESIINIDSSTYEPKIYIYGFISSGQSVKDIKIERNFPINTKIDLASLAISDAEVILIDLSTNENYKLNYNPITKKYDCIDIVIKNSVSYMLSVDATIDGKSVHAYGTTTVPKGGITINKELSKLETFSLEEKDINGNYKYFEICWDVSGDDIPSFEFRVEVITRPNSLSISEEYYAYISNLDRPLYPYRYYWDSGYPDNFIIYRNNYTNNSYCLRIEGYDLGRVGRFRVVIDYVPIEYSYYVLEPKEIRDADGNFVPAKSFINGDGVGFFGSTVCDYTGELIFQGRQN
jgi:hypothetical protein